MANKPTRPGDTKLFIDEGYVSGLEDNNVEAMKMIERWKGYLKPLMDFLEILRDNYDDFDKALNHFNEADNGVNLIVQPDESIKFQPDE